MRLASWRSVVQSWGSLWRSRKANCPCVGELKGGNGVLGSWDRMDILVVEWANKSSAEGQPQEPAVNFVCSYRHSSVACRPCARQYDDKVVQGGPGMVRAETSRKPDYLLGGPGSPGIFIYCCKCKKERKRRQTIYIWLVLRKCLDHPGHPIIYWLLWHFSLDRAWTSAWTTSLTYKRSMPMPR